MPRVKLKLADDTPFRHSPLRGYWGGKGLFAKYIVALIDAVAHRCYIEPFFGGGSVFFARRVVRVQEILNDSDPRVYAFWRAVVDGVNELPHRVENHYPNSQEELLIQLDILNNAEKHAPIDVAFAVIYCTQFCFGGNTTRNTVSVNVGEYSRQHTSRKFSKRADWLRAAFWRMRQTQFLNRDAMRVITKYADDEEVLFYLDPPYVGGNADQGSYAHTGWDSKRFDELLEVLSGAKSKFVLSEYRSDALNAAIEKNGWRVRDVKTRLLSSGQKEGFNTKVETLVWNFDAPDYTPERYTPSAPSLLDDG